MSELSTRGRAAVAALQEDLGSDAAEARVRARLSALGVAMIASGVNASLVSSAAASVAAPSVAPAAMASVGLGGAAGAAPATLVSGSAGVASVSLAPAAGAVSGGSVVAGAGLLTKLASVPLALKASAVVVLMAGVGTVALPASQTQPTPRGTPAAQVAHAPQLRVPQVEMKLPAASATSALPDRTEEGSGQAGAEAAVVPEPAPAHAARPASSENVLAGARAPQPGVARAAQPAPEAASSSTLGAEGTLLSTALRALRAGQREHAEYLLDYHERVYGPQALLARERERMREELSQTLR